MSDTEIKGFRDLDAWNVAMDLAVLAYNTAKMLPATERYDLSSQLRRAAVSVPSNIAEGQSTGADGRYIYHLRIALGSVGELSTDIELAVRLGFISAATGEPVQQQLTRTGRLVFGLLRSQLKKRRARVIKGLTVFSLALWIFQVAVLS